MAASGIIALTKTAIDSYAEYEQLIGGAELMFGDAFDTIKKYSQDAYKTVQMSQNEYLQQVNGFATGLKTALGGNEEAAADLANKIVTAEADIIAATGNTAENVQNAFNGIMRSNFTMLDNLQIGITPTKEGFQEVIEKVNEWNAANGRATQYQMGNLADMQSALVDYVDMVGMSGYANAEASKTIQGSLASAKAAWSNLMTSVADDNANFDEVINNFVDSVVSVAENLLPRVETALSGGAKLISTLFPEIVNKLPEIISSVLPQIATAAVGIIQTLVSTIGENQAVLADTIVGTVELLLTSILNMLPQLVGVAAQLIISLANGISRAIPTLIPTIVSVATEIISTLLDPQVISGLTDAALGIIMGLADGLIAALPILISSIPEIFDNFAQSWTTFYPQVMMLGQRLLIELIPGILAAIPQLIAIVPSLIFSFIKAFGNFVVNIFEVGFELILSLKDGIVEAWESIKQFFIESVPQIIESIVTFFSELPSKVKEWFVKVVDKLVEWYDETKAKISELLPQIIQYIVDFYAELPNKIAQKLTEVIVSISNWIGEMKAKISGGVPTIIQIFIGFFTGVPLKMLGIGKDIVNGLWSGLKNGWSWLTNQVGGLVSRLIQGVKDKLGIHSPSRVFAEIGEFMAQGMGIGWNDEFGNVYRDITNSLDFGGGYIGSFAGNGLGYGNNYGSRDINITQNIYSQEKSAAELMREARWQAKMGVLSSV